MNSFRLGKITQEIEEIIEMQASGRNIKIDLAYESALLQHSRFMGHPSGY